MIIFYNNRSLARQRDSCHFWIWPRAHSRDFDDVGCGGRRRRGLFPRASALSLQQHPHLQQRARARVDFLIKSGVKFMVNEVGGCERGVTKFWHSPYSAYFRGFECICMCICTCITEEMLFAAQSRKCNAIYIPLLLLCVWFSALYGYTRRRARVFVCLTRARS